MQTFACACGATLFFESHRCLSCGREAGWCPACRGIVALEVSPKGELHCTRDQCSAALVKCRNYAEEHVCNRCLRESAQSAATGEALCDCCRFNRTIPDLSVGGNRLKWYRLEVAKRRMLYDLSLLELPIGDAENGVEPPLAFNFMADVEGDARWHNVGPGERVHTGHRGGTITINLREADDLERERLRVGFDEPQRTLIGHFRHEFGHYFWDMLVRGRCEAACQQVFGDHSAEYAAALDRYYRQGAPPNWQSSYVTAYATAHPWEDFAETFGAYVAAASVLDTAANFGLDAKVRIEQRGDLDAMMAAYRRVGLLMNEMNRSQGLLDFLPHVLTVPVLDKLRFVHSLVCEVAERPPSATGKCVL